MQRLFQLLARLIFYYCLFIIFLLTWPLSGIIGGIVVYRKIKNRRIPSSNALGSARFAEEADLMDAGMLGATSGLILGRMIQSSRKGDKLFARESDPLIRLPGSIHNLICGPSGSGKGVSFVMPELETNPNSMFVLDLKGELAARTASLREKRFGHRSILLDSYHTVTKHPDSYNPFDSIPKLSPFALDDCNVIGNALVVRSGHEKDPHFLDSAEFAIAAIAATVIGYGEPGSRSLLTVHEILSHSTKLETAIKVMRESDLWGGALSNMGGQLSHFIDREKASVLTTALRFLRFLGTPAIASSVTTSSFDPHDLHLGKMTIYCIVPPERAYALAGLLRLYIGSLLRICMKEGVK